MIFKKSQEATFHIVTLSEQLSCDGADNSMLACSKIAFFVQAAIAILGFEQV
ncbi:MAG: hypothetical protein AAGG02_19710 [Cyanobacteria bacterium P01_H01_bin.15]